MRMIPDRVDPDTESNAEKALFRQLHHLDDPRWSVALHSLNLSEHLYQRMGEIDFLIVGPHGVFVLEVKGGRVTTERGVWRTRNRYGREQRLRKSPFKQAEQAMHSLRGRLERLLPPELLRRAVFGYAVVLPDMIFDLDSVEWSEELMIDRRQLGRPDGLERSLNRLAAYWRSKPGGRKGTLDDDDIQALVTSIRPDYDAVPTLARSATATEIELAALTERQYRALDTFPRNPRIIYEGGAGTGKTLLAVEMARRGSATGSSVLFTCRSPVIAGYVGAQPGLESVDVVPFDRIRTVSDRKFDLLVVDEAQDLINQAGLDAFEDLLTGGLNDGRWLVFLDSNNQRGLVGSFDPEAMEYLRLTRPAELSLTDNCRNTATVVQRVTRLTGADVGVSTAGVGPEVRFIREAGAAPTAAAVATALDDLAADGVPADQIMLLSGEDLRQSSFNSLPSRWRQRIDTVDLNSWHSRPRSRLGFARVGDFKGLESPFVILADVAPRDEDRSGSEKAALYVGMTRARVGLVVVAPATIADAAGAAEGNGNDAA